MFVSRSLVEHLARGAICLAALVASVLVARASLWLAMALLPVALVAVGGCPMCWTLGLIQMVRARARGEHLEEPCADGGCAWAPPSRR
ncbi:MULTISPECIES: hypothetical protein [Sorangium]|uniref:DUF2892 domain-containing protein n=1 Tax=Sorangium cellulosum (strain So ce56) TaxID=448385 RepID=A9FKM7_SORC5|nr:hypothetical protein [Sorangium cellulosum]CAN95131.1 hypothetical protein predicted by Glimmer/Critica [Sorangium cellulosum So ce56]